MWNRKGNSGGFAMRNPRACRPRTNDIRRVLAVLNRIREPGEMALSLHTLTGFWSTLPVLGLLERLN